MAYLPSPSNKSFSRDTWSNVSRFFGGQSRLLSLDMEEGKVRGILLNVLLSNVFIRLKSEGSTQTSETLTYEASSQSRDQSDVEVSVLFFDTFYYWNIIRFRQTKRRRRNVTL